MRAPDKRDLVCGELCGEEPPGGGTLSPGAREVSVGCTPGGVGAGTGPGHRVGCGHSHPSGLPARPASCARRAPAGPGSESLSLHLHSGDLDRLQKAPSELVFLEPAGVFLLVVWFWFFCKALMGVEGMAAELWEEVEDENIYLFICGDFRKLDEDRRLRILQVEVTPVS